MLLFISLLTWLCLHGPLLHQEKTQNQRQLQILEVQHSEAMPERRFTIIITIIIGRGYPKCEGFGFCKVIYDPVWSLAGPGVGTGTGYMEKDRFHVEFDYSKMDPGTIKTYFNSGYFLVEVDYDLPPEITKELGIESYKIKAGRYPIVELPGNKALVVF